jgi:hypothetical protein
MLITQSNREKCQDNSLLKIHNAHVHQLVPNISVEYMIESRNKSFKLKLTISRLFMLDLKGYLPMISQQY